MHDDLPTSLVPVLARRSENLFNVFDVMRHGTHEKQLSNVFAWLLDAEGTHRLGDAFQRIFVNEVNRGLTSSERVPMGRFSVRQEVNTSESDAAMDIADIILEDHETTLVVENYYTSAGHGHDYERYLNFGARHGKRSVVVMLCETEHRSALTDGWQNAPIVVYAELLAALSRLIEGDADYRRAQPQQCIFIDHMQRRFVKGLKVNDEILIDFLDVLCTTGEAKQFGYKNRDDAAINLGDRLREATIERFSESRELLTRAKGRLRDYAKATLIGQVNEVLGEECLREVTARYQGIYEWTINIHGSDQTGQQQHLQLKFGPSAWNANAQDAEWLQTVPLADADYSQLFVTDARRKVVRQSTVSLKEALDGMAPNDFRLRDDIVALMRSE